MRLYQHFFAYIKRYTKVKATILTRSPLSHTKFCLSHHAVVIHTRLESKFFCLHKPTFPALQYCVALGSQYSTFPSCVFCAPSSLPPISTTFCCHLPYLPAFFVWPTFFFLFLHASLTPTVFQGGREGGNGLIRRDISRLGLFCPCIINLDIALPRASSPPLKALFFKQFFAPGYGRGTWPTKRSGPIPYQGYFLLEH